LSIGTKVTVPDLVRVLEDRDPFPCLCCMAAFIKGYQTALILCDCVSVEEAIKTEAVRVLLGAKI
jgi:hypothetical protein